ncbi:atrial natriuretic peptide receptor 3-like [Lethenteron reissneri]|uniref:atrial natriuretic peptide receptor 3-like n=1 Tax=Lethenteron reissneri TaxID=7753 RepID=UPI002AB7778E|nr:atrial natriuretic peptide receptor 3-like [Lethenteron reissneri]
MGRPFNAHAHGLQAAKTMLTMVMLLLMVPTSLRAHNRDRGGDSRLVRVLVLLPTDRARLFSQARVRPAIEYARESVTGNATLLPAHRFSIHFADSGCGNEALFSAVDFYTEHGAPHLILGPACEYAAAPVARLAVHWGVPMVSAGALASGFSSKGQASSETSSSSSSSSSPGSYSKDEYETLTRVAPAYTQLGALFLAMFRRFSWSGASLIYNDDKKERDCFFTVEGIHQTFATQHHGFELQPVAFDSEEQDLDFGEMLEGVVISGHAVVIICAGADSVREILLEAHRKGMTGGDHVFFNIELFNSTQYGDGRWRRGDGLDGEARAAFRALRTVTLLRTQRAEFDSFSVEMKRRSRETFNFSYDDNVNMFVEGFHDGVVLYSLALHEVLEAGGSISSGRDIVTKMWNRTFQGIAGPVTIDQNGDRVGDFSVLAMDDGEDGRQMVVANYYGRTESFEEVAGARVSWPQEALAVVTPHGTQLAPHECVCHAYGLGDASTVAIIVGFLLVCALLFATFVFRRLYEVRVKRRTSSLGDDTEKHRQLRQDSVRSHFTAA